MRPSDYEPYCQADRAFYDDPAVRDDTAGLYPQATAPLPPGWERTRDGVWVYHHPQGTVLPDQGWKIHVSGTPDEAPRIIDTVLDHCHTHALSVKYLRSRETVLKANAKYAPRGSSGKLLTLYPRDEDELRTTLEALEPLLDGHHGPYILSDLRWRTSILYVRYGAFRQLYCLDDQGRTVSALRDATGTLVPDRRRPVFSVPDWITVPPFLNEQIHTRTTPEPAPDDFPYTIERALHFSNGGGVYKARDRRDGRTVVLREARPLAGLDTHGTDAVQRLHRERDMLRRLEGLDFVPRLYEHRTVWEHEYLVEEFIDGEKLERFLFTGRHPLLDGDPDPRRIAEHTALALDFAEQLTRMLATLHERGVAFGDLHPGNVMVRPDGRLALVDFELAFDLENGTPPAFGAPGFISPAARTGTAVDHYALACLRLFLFLPLTFLIELDAGKAADLAHAAAERFALPGTWPDELLADLTRATAGPLPPGSLHTADSSTATATATATATGATGAATATGPGPAELPDTATPEGLARLADDLAAGILAAATPHRSDRLHPGDPEQFTRQGTDLAHGAAGVLYALTATGRPVPAEHLDWLREAARHPKAVHPGLYDGLAGTALTLEAAGRGDDARDVLERVHHLTATRDDLGVLGPSLASGLAGLGLTHLHFAHRHPGDAADLTRRAETLAHRLTTAEPPTRTGLLHGPAGSALFLTRLYEHTGDKHWLTAAHAALTHDLARARHDHKGLLLAHDGRTTAYLADGSAGAALAARALLAHLDDPALTEAADQLEKACEAEFVLMPGLFEGRAGLITALAASPAPRARTHLHRQLARLTWHLVRHQGRAAVPGHQLLRLSCDLATGSAGLLLALHAAATGRSALPLIDPRDAPAPR
ncbi:class III lanthionine synthetase LanKC [Kitasatospora sp. NPDC051170]|uniref:class III lanthionine synthetase LanKC n=1 Tax=Kitasatospora sp. NPDC051170 TaxID=3364056 RepID=UPI0037A78707